MVLPGIEYTPGRTPVLDYEQVAQTVAPFVGPKNARLYALFIGAYVSLVLDNPLDKPDPGRNGNTSRLITQVAVVNRKKKPLRVATRFYYKLLTTPAKSLVITFSSLSDRILQSLDVSTDLAITGEFIEEMKDTPIFREYLHFYNTGDAACLQFVLSFLRFGSKLDFDDADLHATALRDWREIESGMGTFSTPSETVDCLRIIVRQMIPDIDDTLLLPKHGPGAVVEGTTDPNEKLDLLTFDEKAWRCFRPNSFGRVGLDRRSEIWISKERREQIGKLRIVPKTVKAARTICMETASRMLLQQEVSRWIRVSMRKYSLRNIVDLADQSYNRAYALAGSFSQSCDTLDLSAASDRVHWDLVRRIFPAKVLYYLAGTRTSKVSTPDGVVTLNKFAPMGSALCFPIQCIVFSAITLLGYLKSSYGEKEILDSSTEGWYYLHHIDAFMRQMHSDPSQLRSKLLLPRIYGDDIIVDYRATNDVLSLLAECGLKVNLDKSFIGGSPFRESCGIFAYWGEDVTPLLFRVPRVGRKLDANVVASIFDQANRSGDFKYHHLRSLFINYVCNSKVAGIYADVSASIPWTTNRDDFGIYTTNPHAPKVVRENKSLQREERRVLVLRALYGRQRVSPFMEEYAYDQWIRARLGGGVTEDNFSAPRRRPKETRIRLGWIPA